MAELSRSPASTLGWHNRGYLPHFDGGQLAQFITFRLYDSLPRDVIVRWKEELKLEQSAEAASMFRRKIEAYLDQGWGSCYLQNPDVARMVENALLFHDVTKYKLSAWVVMPNHVHILSTPAAGYGLAEIMHSIKSFTSNEANRMLDRAGRFWQKDTSIGLFAIHGSSRGLSLTSRTIQSRRISVIVRKIGRSAAHVSGRNKGAGRMPANRPQGCGRSYIFGNNTGNAASEVNTQRAL